MIARVLDWLGFGSHGDGGITGTIITVAMCTPTGWLTRVFSI
jgi:hypothetical protein